MWLLLEWWGRVKEDAMRWSVWAREAELLVGWFAFLFKEARREEVVGPKRYLGHMILKMIYFVSETQIFYF